MKLGKKKIPTSVFIDILKKNVFTSSRFERMFGKNMYSKAAGLLKCWYMASALCFNLRLLLLELQNQHISI